MDDQKQLKLHLATAPHSRLSVICPWCYDQEGLFSRMFDLKRHTKKLHPELKGRLPSSFFTEVNGFWLSHWPEDYHQLVVPSESISQEATMARSFIIEWSSRVLNPSRTLPQWRKGWALGIPEAEPPSKRQQLEVQYSPSRPNISEDELTLVEIRCVDGQFEANLISNTTWYKVEISNQIQDDPKSLQALTRRMIITPQPSLLSEKPQGTGIALRGRLLTTALSTISTKLNIPVRFLQAVTESSRPTLVTPRQLLSPSLPDSPETVVTAEDLLRSISPSTFTNPMTSGQIGILPRPFPVMMSQESTVLEPQSPPEISRVVELPMIIDQPANLQIQIPQLITSSLKEATVTTIKDRALNLLKNGGMPLFAPAQRRWDEEEEVTLSRGDTTVNWPPKGWKTLTSQQRLMVTEFAAMKLAFQQGIFNVKDKTELLDQYNFLVLPGVPSFTISQEARNRHQLRYDVYNSLRTMAISGRGDEQLLNMLELASVGRSREVDDLILTIEKKGILLRLIQENKI